MLQQVQPLAGDRVNAYERTVVHLLVRIVAALEGIPAEWVLERPARSQQASRTHPDVWLDD